MKLFLKLLRKHGLRHFLNVVKKNWKDPYWWKWQFLDHILCPLLFRENNGFYILKEEFDNLIILDACRFDLFESEIKNWNIKGRLEYRISRGSDTLSFLLENFGDNKFNPIKKKIVYITANPFVNREFEGEFWKIIPVWLSGWDEELNTVPPKAVYKATIQAIRRYQGKKFIIHFIQPHCPFIKIGKLARIDKTFVRLREAMLSGEAQKVDLGIWGLLQRGKVTEEEVLWGYKENLRAVMPYVEKLCKILPGRTVITADHGEAIGEKLHPIIPLRIYGHPCGNIRMESLIKVPWFICEESGNLDRVEKEIIRLKVKEFKSNSIR